MMKYKREHIYKDKIVLKQNLSCNVQTNLLIATKFVIININLNLIFSYLLHVQK